MPRAPGPDVDHAFTLKVPLGKLNTERVVPLDADTLTVLDAWMAVRGRQRALTHPRHGHPSPSCSSSPAPKSVPTAPTPVSRPHQFRRPQRPVRAAAADHPAPAAPHTYATSLVNAGMSLQALMALLGHVSPQMTSRNAALANGTVRAAYDAAMIKLHQRRLLPMIVAGRPVVPDRVVWLNSEMIKTRIAHGYCSRHLAAEACPYANICENCDNYLTTAEFLPQLQDQLADTQALHDPAVEHGWDSEVARHARLSAASNATSTD
jgi:hypothetical protein